MFRKPDPSICCLVIFALAIVNPLSNAQATCWQNPPGTHAAVNEDCAPCVSSISCPGGTADVLVEYDYCKVAGTGVSGKCECWHASTNVGDSYDCETNWDGINMAACVILLGLCAVSCIWIGWVCAFCLAGVGVGCAAAAATCGFVESCDKDMGSSTPVYRMVFDSLTGDSCEGE